MRKTYLITYDLFKPGQNYEDLFNELKRYIHIHILDSTWLICTTETPDLIWDKLRQCIDNNDRILIIEVKRNYQGWLSKNAWEWINENVYF